MRNSFLSIIALLAVASCAVKEDPHSVSGKGQQAVEYTLHINGTINEPTDAETKTVITEDGSKFHSYWVNGNSIRVDFDGVTTTPSTGEYSSTNGNFTCSKSGLTEGSHTIYAAYPSSTGRNDSDTYTFTVPTSQTIPGVNAICESADYLIASPKVITVDESGSIDDVDMVFNRHTAILKIIPVDNTTGKILDGKKIKRITISYPTKISTKVKVNKDGKTVTKIDTGSSSFEINYSGDDFEFNSDVTGTVGAYLVVAPGQFTKTKAITFSIETDDDKVTISKTIASLPNDITFGANQLRPITVSFGDSNVEEVTPEIVPVTPSKLDYNATYGSFTFTVSNPDGVSEPSVSVTSGGTWLALDDPSITESAGVYTVHFTCSMNDAIDAEERSATIEVSYAGADDVPVTIYQKKNGVTVTYLWSFTGAISNGDMGNPFIWSSNTVGQTISYSVGSSDEVRENPSKSGIYCLKMNGSSSSTTRRFTYTAPRAGTLTIIGYQYSGTNSLTVKLGEKTVSPEAGSSGSFTSTSEPTTNVYTISAAGTVVFYTDVKSYFKSVEFSYTE